MRYLKNEIFKRIYQCQPVPPVHPDEMDCNYCGALTTTEDEQREYIRLIPMASIHPIPEHRCRKYKVQVFHEGHPVRIRPCNECYQDILGKCVTEKKEELK